LLEFSVKNEGGVYMNAFKIYVLVLFLGICGQLNAEVLPSSLFTDNMVVQQGRSLPVWGEADPGERVTVTFIEDRKSTEADAKGRWMVR
jgi:sialate O-acetylesterase